MKPSEYHACATGDCPHDTQDECVLAVLRHADELHAEVERLRAEVGRLEPYRKIAEAHERQKERQAKEDAEIAAGLRCGGGYRDCNGGPDCDYDHK